MQGQVPGVVGRGVPLLVGALLLLVDDDQADLGQGREDGRAGPDHHPDLPAAQLAPEVELLPLRELVVPQGEGKGEALLEVADQLDGEGDLGHEYDRLAVRG